MEKQLHLSPNGQAHRDEILDRANKRAIYIEKDGTRYPAIVSGRLLAFPYITAGLFHFEINWKQVESLANGETDTIIC